MSAVTWICVSVHHNLYLCVSCVCGFVCMCVSSHMSGAERFVKKMSRWHEEAFLPASTLYSHTHTHTHTSSFRRMTARFYGWLDYIRKHCTALIVGKPRLRRIIIPFAPPLFSNFVGDETGGREWGKGAMHVGWGREGEWCCKHQSQMGQNP